MKNLYVYILVIFSGCLQSQTNLENANWIFGNVSWLDFNNNSLVSPLTPSYGTNVTSLTPQPLYNNYEGCASISDEDGNLLFFTDGARVYRIVNNEIVIIDYNSTSDNLVGNFSSIQNTIIVPKPGTDGRYFLISVNGFSSDPKGLYWSELDINTNQFISKNNVMGDGTNVFNAAFYNQSEAITSCVASNGVDMWVIVHIRNNTYSKVLSYSVTSSGISTTPISSFDTASLASGWSPYTIKISPNASRLALSNARLNPFVGTFNNLTGQVYVGPTSIGDNSINNYKIAYSLEFSPDSNILYFSRGNASSPPNVNTGIFAVQLNNPTVESQVFSTGINSNEIGTLQRGLNGRLYASRNSQNSILEIANPNSFGAWSTSYINLNVGNLSKLGLPQWIWKTCKNTLNLTSPNSDVNGRNSNRERSEWISASNIINTGQTFKVVYHAGNFVELNPGFEAVTGSQFSAYIQGCSGNYVYKNDDDMDEKDETVSPDLINNKFNIYPNPTSGLLNVSLSNSKIKKIVLTSIDGKVYIFEQFDNSENVVLDLSTYSSGIYLMNVETDRGEIINSKVIKN